MNRITIMSVLAALALIMAPGFAAQAAGPDTSPDMNVNASSTDIAAPDTEVGDDVGEVADAEDVDVGEVEDMDVAEVEDVETPDIEEVDVEAPEHGD